MLHKIEPIYIISGGTGASGEQLIHTILAQYPGVQIPVKTIAHVRHYNQIKDIISQVASTGGLIVHTLVDVSLRKHFTQLCEKESIVTFDLMGDILGYISAQIGQKPACKPGLYRKLHSDYFDRVASIEFAMKHDDGLNFKELSQAEIVLVGVSRVGKTPLSMYLAVLGWKAANVPIVQDIALPEELFQVDRRRVFGLSIKPERLLLYRKVRKYLMGMQKKTSYDNPKMIYNEIENANWLFRKNKFSIINVTNKPIEASSNEIIELISIRFKEKARKSIP